MTVTADWLGIRRNAKGAVLARLFQDPVEYLVQFPTGKHGIPGGHLNCAHSLTSSPLFPPISLRLSRPTRRSTLRAANPPVLVLLAATICSGKRGMRAPVSESHPTARIPAKKLEYGRLA